MQERQNTELRIAMFEHLLAQDQARPHETPSGEKSTDMA